MRLNTEVVKALDMLTVCHDARHAWKPSFSFSTVGIDFLSPFRLPPEINTFFWSVIISPSGMRRSRYQISQLWQQLKLSWIIGSPDLAAPRAFIPTKDVILKLIFFTSLTKLLQLDKTRTTAFHPQSNADIERTNRTLLNMLAKTTDKNQRTWSELLPCVMLAYCTSVRESTGYTPYFLLFGHVETLPLDLQFPPPSDDTWRNYHKYVAPLPHGLWTGPSVPKGSAERSTCPL